MDDQNFIGNIFPQRCGLNLTVLEKTNLKQSGRNPLFICQFEDGEKILCRKDHVLRGTIQNKNKNEEHENEFLFKEWKQNEGHIVIPIKKSKKQISGIYAYEGYIKGYENEGTILFLKSYAQRGTISNPFLVWKTKERFEKYLNNINFEPTIYNISKDLNLSLSMVGQLIYKYKIFDKIHYNPIISKKEIELLNYIKSIYRGKIDRYILSDSKEIDIYLPDLKLGFEFNGNFWHCEINKSREYHKKKSLLAKKENIRLVHIWEYEWIQDEEKIKKYIKDLLNLKKEIIYARNCKVKEITTSEYNDFCRNFHLQGICAAKVKLGLFYKDELVQIMSFGCPRFTDKYEWEIIRECSKFEICIVGGKEKLWKYFVKNYNPNNCISYCDFNKFIGESYLKLGFEFNGINKDFIWWEEGNNIIHWRNPYKHNELKNRCLKIWRAGQLVFVWKNKNLNKN